MRPDPIFAGIAAGSTFYFVHSFAPVPEDPATVIATCNYGSEFVAAVRSGNRVGVQFHPERSGPVGLRILGNFVDECREAARCCVGGSSPAWMSTMAVWSKACSSSISPTREIPVELAARYVAEGADEICFLDITASHEGRDTMLDVVRRTAEQVFVPLTVGGGVRTVDDMRATLRAGADRVTVNTAAVERPDLIAECAEAFGAQCVVLAIDAKKRSGPGWEVYTHGGRIANRSSRRCLGC